MEPFEVSAVSLPGDGQWYHPDDASMYSQLTLLPVTPLSGGDVSASVSVSEGDVMGEEQEGWVEALPHDSLLCGWRRVIFNWSAPVASRIDARKIRIMPAAVAKGRN